MRTPARRSWRATAPKPGAPGSGWRRSPPRPRSSSRRREAERAELQEKVAELKKLGLKEGEWDELAAQHQRLAHGSSLLAGAQSSLEALSEADGACLPQLSRGREPAARAVGARRAAEGDRRHARIGRSAGGRGGARPARLRLARRSRSGGAARGRTRIEALHAAGRKYRVKPARAAGAGTGTRRCASGNWNLPRVPRRCSARWRRRKARYDAAAKKLSAKRKSGAQALGKDVTQAMQGLAMSGGRFAVSLTPLDAAGRHGRRRSRVRGRLASEPAAAAAREGGLRRRAVAHQPRDPAGRREGIAGRHAGVRRGRFGHRRRGRGNGRALAEEARRAAPGVLRHAPPAGRRAGRRAVVGVEIRRQRQGQHARSRGWTAPGGSRNWRACWAARKSPRRRASTPRNCWGNRNLDPRVRGDDVYVGRCGQFGLVQSPYSASEWPRSSKPFLRAISLWRFSISAS